MPSLRVTSNLASSTSPAVSTQAGSHWAVQPDRDAVLFAEPKGFYVQVGTQLCPDLHSAEAGKVPFFTLFPKVNARSPTPQSELFIKEQ
jgi:hypothetical protein